MGFKGELAQAAFWGGGRKAGAAHKVVRKKKAGVAGGRCVQWASDKHERVIVDSPDRAMDHKIPCWG